MKAIAEKLIPGIHEGTRIAILQQTRDEDLNTETTAAATEIADSTSSSPEGRSVLQEVIEKATAKYEVEQEIRGQEDYPLPLSLLARGCC
jgi:hypothetical protein